MKTKRISRLELKNKLFFQFPKFLMLDNNYRKLTNDSKVLYVLYYERSRLSLKNNWVDDNNFVYIKYKNEKAMEILNCRSEKLSKIKKELKQYGLIDEVRQGKNKPNIIYVLEPTLSNIDIDEFNDLEPTEIDGYSKIEQPDIRKSNTGNSKIECQDVRKSNKSNNDLSNNKFSNKEEYVEKNEIKENKNIIDYDSILETYNTVCIDLPKAIKLTEKRKGLIKAYFKNHNDLNIMDYFKRINQAKFLCGSSGWKADFEFIFKEDNIIKILEGKYDHDFKNTKSESKGNALDRLYEKYKT